MNEVRQYITNLPNNVQLIVTSREDSSGLEKVDLIEFTDQEAHQYLQNILKEKKYTENELSELIKTVGCLPLRLALASSYLACHKLATIT